MDDITSNQHVGVVVVSLAILLLGLVSTTFGAGHSPLPSTTLPVTETVPAQP
jgi:hypothetical protein